MTPAHNPLDLADLFAYVEANRALFIDRLIDYVRRPSISAQGIGMGEVAAFLVDLLSGLGLELSVVKHVVEAHGGTVEATSPGEGKGSTFTVRLPTRATRISEDA